MDRGPQGLEIVCILLALYVAWPQSVVLNRGNHEDYAICCVYGFQKVRDIVLFIESRYCDN